MRSATKSRNIKFSSIEWVEKVRTCFLDQLTFIKMFPKGYFVQMALFSSSEQDNMAKPPSGNFILSRPHLQPWRKEE